MRARLALGCLGGVALGLGGVWACIPNPSGAFEDFQERIKSFEGPPIEEAGPPVEAGPPPTEATEGLYYGACYSELALGQVTNVLSFYTKTKFTPDAAGGQLELTIEALKFENLAPPAKVSREGITGGIIPAPAAAVNAEGQFTLSLGTVSVPGDANPISQSEVLIENAQLQGRFAAAQFCGRLTGFVVKPAAASRNLDIEKNFCQFRPIKDGDDTPVLTRADFQPSACPL